MVPAYASVSHQYILAAHHVGTQPFEVAQRVLRAPDTSALPPYMAALPAYTSALPPYTAAPPAFTAAVREIAVSCTLDFGATCSTSTRGAGTRGRMRLLSGPRQLETTQLETDGGPGRPASD